MHPDLAIALYRHEGHELDVRLELQRANLEKSGSAVTRTVRRHRPHRNPLRARR